MSLVTCSLFALKRARKELGKAHDEGDWEAVQRWDVELANSLNHAFDDGSRDTKALINELETILSAYSHMVAAMPEKSSGRFVFPGTPV
ncbi:MAG: hypothetical protein ACI9Y1_000246 [Lentisphaeria bacterium]|jgi:hypothetical protein